MAQRVVRLDDIDGTDNAVQRFFEFDGVMYTIDLGASSFAAMSAVLQPFVDAATVVRTRPDGARLRPQSAPSGCSPRRDHAAVREWARRHGIAVASTGRLSKQLLARYDARHHDGPPREPGTG